MRIRPVVPVFAFTFSLLACTTPQNANLISASTPPQAVASPSPSPSRAPGLEPVVSPTPLPTVSGEPVLGPDALLPEGLAAIRIAVTERFLNGRGETTRLVVTGLDAQGQPLTGALPLSFSQNRPDDFSISPDGVVTALKDFGFSEVVIRVVGTPLEARTTLSVSLPSTYSGGSSGSSGGGGAVVGDNRPQITGFSANSVLAGTQVTINGARFGNNLNALMVLFAGIPAQIISASNTAITVVVPRTSGNPQITVNRDGEIASATGLNVHKLIFVDHEAQGIANGSTWIDAYPSLQAGLSDAVGGDKIWVAEGTYRPAAPSGDRAATFQMVAGVDVLGGFAGTEADPSERAVNGNEVILSGDLNNDDGVITDPLVYTEGSRQDNSYNVVVAASNIHLDRLTIARGNASGEGQQGRGGGLWASGFVNIALTNLVFRENSAAYHGGGVYSLNNLIDFENCTFEINRTRRLGGGMALYHGANVTRPLQLKGIRFAKNQSGDEPAYGNAGGGLYLSTHAQVEDAEFESNTSYFAGGALVYGAAPTFRNVRFLNNEAISGGGLTLESASGSLVEDALFSGNQALEPVGNSDEANRGSGGGLTIIGFDPPASQITLNRIVFNQNTATSYGGAIFFGYDNGISNSLNLTNGVFAGNQVLSNVVGRGQGGAMFIASGGNAAVQVRYSTFASNTTTGPDAFGLHVYDSTVGSPNPVNLDGSLFYATSIDTDAGEVDITHTGVNIDGNNFIDVNAPFGVSGTAFFDFSQAGLRLQEGSGLRFLSGLTPVPGTDLLGRSRSSANTDWGAYQTDASPL